MSKVTGLCQFLEEWESEDLPNGAWWAHLEEGVDAYNKEMDTKFDRNNGVHFYVNYKHRKQEQQK